MDAVGKNNIVEYSVSYGHIIERGKTISLESFADLIEKHYDKSNPVTKSVCRWLRGTEGNVSNSINSGIIIHYKKHKN